MKRISRALWLPAVLAAATLACSLVPSLQTTPTPPPAGETAQPATSIPATLPPPASDLQGKIAYATERDGTWQVIAINPDGSEEVQLTAPFSGAYSRPSWSPDGTRLGLRMDIPTSGIAVMDVRHSEGRLTGTQPVALVSEFSDGPFWAPDGQSLLYTTTLGSGGWVTMHYNLATGETRQLTGIPENSTDPTFSPDGSRIIFTFYTDPSTQIHDLFVINADGSGFTNLTNTPSDSEYLPAWSPDGSRIAFSSSRYNEDSSISASDLFIMNADGSNRVQLTTHPEGDFDAAWSPDGTMLAFTSERDSANDSNYEIYIINADGTGETRLTNNRVTDRWPSWRASLPEDAPPAACEPAITFVADVTIPPGTRFAQPQPFTKIWRVRNAGSCTWTPTNYRLQSTEGAWAASQPVQLPGAIQPGAEADLTVRVSAPEAPGLHTGSWVLMDGNGQPVPNSDGDVEGLALQVEVLPPGSTPLARPLYFTRSEGAPSELWRMETDGRTLTQLTNEAQNVASFSVAPDGRIAFTSGGSVFVTDASGGNRQTIGTYKLESFSSVTWSPDGRRLAYANGGVHIRDMDTGVDNLILPDVDTGMPGLLIYRPLSWSPDGTKLIVGVGQWEGAVMNIISQDGTILDEFPYITGIWGRNSQNVFYSGVLSEGMMMTEPGLWAQPASGGDRVTLMSGSDVYWPTQAPDGPLFAFVQQGSSDELALIRTDERGSEVVPVLPRPFYIRNSDNFLAAWSADAGSVAMYVYRPALDAGEFTVQPLDGTPPLFLMQDVEQFAWGP